MNRVNGRRSLRTALAGWLRALLRRSPIEPGPDPAANSKAADPIEPAQADAGQGEVILSGAAGSAQMEAGEESRRGGPPEHWLALARSKGPPQHWLDLIRARLGNDLSRVPWIRARALPPDQRQPASRFPQIPPASEKQLAPAIPEPLEGSPEGEEPAVKEFVLENEPARQPVVEPRPAAERRQPAAMRMYPGPAVDDQPQAAQPPHVAKRESQTPAEDHLHAESVPQPVPQARPWPAPLADARAGSQTEPQKPPPLPLTSATPISAQMPAPPAPEGAPTMAPGQAAQDMRAMQAAQDMKDSRAMPETAPREPTDHWPAWQEFSFASPLPSPEPAAAESKERYEPEFPVPARTQWPRPRPVLWTSPAGDESPARVSPWPTLQEAGPAESGEDGRWPASLMPEDRWPALGRLEDDDLAADEWESYQRNWQRLERLRREHQGQLWSEWPF